MNKKPDYQAINTYNRQRSDDCKQRVLDAIDKCIKEDNVTTQRVCEIAGVAKNYFTYHPELRQVLDNAKGVVNRKLKKTKQNTDSRLALEKALRAEIALLKKQISALESDESYKDKYEAKCAECEKLKKQLDTAVRDAGLLKF